MTHKYVQIPKSNTHPETLYLKINPEHLKDIISGTKSLETEVRFGQFRVAKNPFSHGVERLAYHGRDDTHAPIFGRGKEVHENQRADITDIQQQEECACLVGLGRPAGIRPCREGRHK